MSIISDRIRIAAAVVVCGGLLLYSTAAVRGLDAFTMPATPEADIRGVETGVAILERAPGQLLGIQPCDAIKALLPNKFSNTVGDQKITTNGADVIVCFQSDIDFAAAVKQAALRGLTWRGEIGGEKIVVFAPSRDRFLQVAALDGLRFARGEVRGSSILLKQLQSHGRARLEDGAWVIPPAVGGEEAVYGPYVTLKPGRYRLDVTLEPVGPDACDTIARLETVEIGVTSRGRVDTLLPRQAAALRPGFVYGGCEVTASATFAVAAPAQSVETPIWLSGFAPMRLTGLTLEPVP